MSENYTAEDFAQATLATRGNTEMARRSGPMETMRWLVLRRDGEWEWINDAAMADEGWTPVVESRVTLGSLAAAYAAAEVPTAENPIREGDVVIYTSACGTGVTVHKAAVGQFGRETHGYVRVLSRAPREPWQDLADDLASYPQTGTKGDLAKTLHALGWRKGGDES